MIVTTDTPHFGFLSYVYRSIFRLPPVVFSHPSFVFRLPFSHLSSFVSRLPFRLLSFRCLSSAFYLLPYTFCLLPSTFRLLPSAFCLLHSIFRLSASVFHLSSFIFSPHPSSAFYLSSPSIRLSSSVIFSRPSSVVYHFIFSHLQSAIFRLPFHLLASIFRLSSLDYHFVFLRLILPSSVVVYLRTMTNLSNSAFIFKSVMLWH